MLARLREAQSPASRLEMSFDLLNTAVWGRTAGGRELRLVWLLECLRGPGPRRGELVPLAAQELTESHKGKYFPL